MKSYIALIHKGPRSDFGISFPDFPGCATAGRSLDEARKMAEEALAFHVDGMREDGETLPEPSSLERVMSRKGNRDAVAVLVALRERPQATMRVNITLAEADLAAIDAHAEASGMTRSGFLVSAARARMASPPKSTRRRRVAKGPVAEFHGSREP
jgi:predicted RNase H-like HicB family nuclease